MQSHRQNERHAQQKRTRKPYISCVLVRFMYASVLKYWNSFNSIYCGVEINSKYSHICMLGASDLYKLFLCYKSFIWAKQKKTAIRNELKTWKRPKLKKKNANSQGRGLQHQWSECRVCTCIKTVHTRCAQAQSASQPQRTISSLEKIFFFRNRYLHLASFAGSREPMAQTQRRRSNTPLLQFLPNADSPLLSSRVVVAIVASNAAVWWLL